ncbi:hypothetical protein XELAEV_18007945mg [Xenopus laevis]|uniref:Uncharacterized protein n=1 Tax=Xenopus laevis TaxID=8355 RepID=A0A974I5P1_XENLA|nr:hypothetical protein XELAEV_18007945mg [Xenopus laevis]
MPPQLLLFYSFQHLCVWQKFQEDAGSCIIATALLCHVSLPCKFYNVDLSRPKTVAYEEQLVILTFRKQKKNVFDKC